MNNNKEALYLLLIGAYRDYLEDLLIRYESKSDNSWMRKHERKIRVLQNKLLKLHGIKKEKQ